MSWTVSNQEAFAYYSSRALRARPLGSLAASLMGVAALCVLSGAMMFARPAPGEIVEAPLPAAAPAAPPASANAEIFAPATMGAPAAARRSASFDLDYAELAREKKVVSSQPPEGGGRQDALAFGEFESGKFYLGLHILHTAGEKLGNSDFYLDMARHASQAGLSVSRIGPPSPLATRFGPFETAEIRLSQSAEGGTAAGAGERGCFATRMQNSKLSIEIAGLACGAGARPIDRRVLSCLLDRLYYAPGGGDASLERFFQKADAERGQGCFAAPAAPSEAVAPVKAKAKKRAAAASH